MTTRTDALLDALDRLADYSYLDGVGFPCHGPMGAETLSTLGHDELVGRWVEAYKERHGPLDAPPPKDRIDPDDEASWRAALGDFVRVADWEDLIRRQLAAEEPWPAVLQQWVPRLLPGYGGALGHGLIRTAHAVRVLAAESRPEPALLDELAKGLGLWAAAFRELPVRADLGGSLGLEEAIRRLPRVRPDAGISVMEAATFSRLDEVGGFPEAVAALGPPPSVERALSDLSAAFCRMLLAHPDLPLGFVHAITPISATRTLLAHVPDLPVETAYAVLWPVDAALTAGFVTRPKPDETAPLPPDQEAPGPTELVARAIEHQDTHVLKLTEACLREHAHSPDPAYLLAARQVVMSLPPW